MERLQNERRTGIVIKYDVEKHYGFIKDFDTDVSHFSF